MPAQSKRRTANPKPIHKNSRKERSNAAAEEVAALNSKCKDPMDMLVALKLVSAHGNSTFNASGADDSADISPETHTTNDGKESKDESNDEPARTAPVRASMPFSSLPLSAATKKGLVTNFFTAMTDIQAQALPYALCGRDVLAAAKTGSGKTLAFLIPVLESLYRRNWSQMDGLGALIISPTRELALQIFQVLRRIGQHHSLSAGLLIGGKDVKQEEARVGKMNILVCTPGRLLQHMDQTPDFQYDALQMLVLDEADKILDFGFEHTLNAIIDNLPKGQGRQTMLFSATQTKSVKDLARLSLNNPQYVGVYEKPQDAIPAGLTQRYLVCQLENKLDILYSFLRSHLKSKVLVFVSSCKQVQFINEAFCKLQPGTVVSCLHGKQKQQKRIQIFDQFSKKQAGVLICTDIAARGLDFPKIDWVVQLDCPEDIQTYIHRVGRTARYNSIGNSLLFLVPSEEKGMLAQFEKGGIKEKVESIRVNPSKTTSIVQNLKAFCSESPEMKYLAQKSIISYARSIYLQGNKEIFDIKKLDLESFAKSIGLFNVPKIDLGEKTDKKNMSRKMLKLIESLQAGEGDSDEGEDNSAGINDVSEDDSKIELYDLKKKKGMTTRVDRMFQKKNSTVLSEHYNKVRGGTLNGDEDDSDDDILTLARKDHDISIEELVSPSEKKIPDVAPTHRQILKSKKKAIKTLGEGKAFIFDEDGNKVPKYALDNLAKSEDTDKLMKSHRAERQVYHDAQREEMKLKDFQDKQAAKDKMREKKMIKKRKRQEAMLAANEDEDDGDERATRTRRDAVSHSEDEEDDE